MSPLLGYLINLTTATEFTYYDGGAISGSNNEMSALEKQYDATGIIESLDQDIFNLNIHDYEFNGTATIALYNQDERIYSDDYLLTAFDGDQCVGYTTGLVLPLELDPENTMIFPLMVYGNEDNVDLTLRAYQVSTNTFHDIDKQLTFTQDMALGDGLDPIIMSMAAQPEVYSIGDPYPNPFNPSMNFEIDIQTDSYVSAKIYNIRGQEIATIHDGMLQGKIHKMTWMASNQASGIYFVRVAINNDPATHKKIILLK